MQRFDTVWPWLPVATVSHACYAIPSIRAGVPRPAAGSSVLWQLPSQTSSAVKFRQQSKRYTASAASEAGCSVSG